jgi:hypothetical protein
MSPKAKGDGESDVQKRPGAPQADTVRPRKNTSTPIVSETTSDHMGLFSDVSLSCLICDQTFCKRNKQKT